MQHDDATVFNATVTAVLDCLLPGDSDWPAAGQHGLAERFCEQLANTKDGADSLEQLVDTLGDNFSSLPSSEQTTLLLSAETTPGAAFERCVAAAYAVYYTDPNIRQRIETLTGYPARPPQPLGYEMEPFDESLLDTVKQRSPFWRQESDS